MRKVSQMVPSVSPSSLPNPALSFSQTRMQPQAIDLYAMLVSGQPSSEETLNAGQVILESLLDCMTTAVFLKDTNYKYLWFNKVGAAFAGVEQSELVGLSDREMPWALDQEFGAAWFEEWDRTVIDTGQPQYKILERLLVGSGEQRWIETNKVPIRNLAGDVIGIIGTFEEVTERVEAEREHRRVLEELDERVKKRTTDLSRANESLRREVEDRIRIQSEERQQRAYAEALRETAAAISRTLVLDEVIEEVIVGVERLVSNDLTALMLFNDDDELELAAHRIWLDYTSEDHLAVHGLEELSLVALLGDRPGPEIINLPDRCLGPAKSCLGTQLRLGDQVIGYLLLESATPNFFTETHAERLRAVTDQATTAISNARLLSRASELAAGDERQRLARDLHDSINQTLWTSAISAESLLRELGPDSPLHERVSRLRLLARGALAEMRTLLLELRPAELELVELHQLIGQLAEALECRRTVQLKLDIQPVELDAAKRLVFYRIAQECLNNVSRHATASTVNIQLGSDVRNVFLRISDDGLGFEPAGVTASHMGVKIMKERAASVGASFTLESTPGKGVNVTVTVRIGDHE